MKDIATARAAAVANCADKTAVQIVEYLVKDVARWQAKPIRLMI
ncbi:MAG: hypothetical protein R3D55_21690 [Chloroflexota bacterium]